VRPHDRLVLEAVYASWAAKDLAAVLACCDDDMVFVIHLPEGMPFAGETRGKEHLAPRLQMIIDAFDFLDYRPVLISDEDDTFHAQIHYHYRHKATGHVIEGTMRHTGRIEGDKIVRLEEFHDTPRLNAFFELLAQSESGKRERPFPIKRNR